MQIGRGSCWKQRLLNTGRTYNYQEWVPFKTFRNQYKPEIKNMNFIAQSAITYKDDIKASGAAAYGIGGWYDAAPAQALAAWKLWGGKVIIGPWAHTTAGEMSKIEHLRWFDYTLKGIKNGIAQEPPIYYYTFNAPPGKEWRFASQWPLPEQRMTKFYFGAGPSKTSASLNDGSLGSHRRPFPTQRTAVLSTIPSRYLRKGILINSGRTAGHGTEIWKRVPTRRG